MSDPQPPNNSKENPELTNKEEPQIKKNGLEKLVSCGFCNRTFYETRLEGHKKICTKEKPFKPLSRKMNKNNSCMIQSIGPKSPEIQEIHEILNNDSILPYFDEKEAYKEQILIKCEKCDRKFDKERVHKHTGICKGKKIANILEEVKTENLLEKNEVLLEKTEKLLLKTEELLENEVKQHKSPILAKPGNFIPLNTRTEENINKIDNKPNKIVNPHDKTPLSLIKNYTKQLLDKKNLVDSKKNRLSTQKSKSPNKKSPINTINTPSLVLMNNMKESIEINIGKDDYPLKNCQFCGKPFLEKNLKKHSNICKNLSKHTNTPKITRNIGSFSLEESINKNLRRKTSILQKEQENQYFSTGSLKNYRVFKSFQPNKAYDFKY